MESWHIRKECIGIACSQWLRQMPPHLFAVIFEHGSQPTHLWAVGVRVGISARSKSSGVHLRALLVLWKLWVPVGKNHLDARALLLRAHLR